MPKHTKPREGSMQFYPRVRAKKIMPRVNWLHINKEGVGLLGFIGYKVGMKTAYVKDNTSNSLTKGKKISIPVTILECPSLKIFSVRFYKNNRVIGEVLNQNIDKEMKRKVKIPKEVKKKIDDFKEEDYDDLKVIVYSQVKKTSIKKTPDLTEMGLSGSKSEKIDFLKNNINKEFTIKDVFSDGLVDIKGVTTGKGNQGPTKRFGLSLGAHKKEKGVRGPGSGGPWHPTRVEFTQPMAGQMGYFTRIGYNNKIVHIGDVNEENINPNEGFKRFGNVRGDYMILYGSVLGPVKRQLIISHPFRPSKDQTKKNYEFIELR